MDQLKGSLRFIPLPALTQFIAGLGSTGHVKLAQGAWCGEILLNGGEIVGAQLGTERGRTALEGMVLGLTTADFAFVDGLVDATTEPLASRDELAALMAALLAERERLQPLPGQLDSIPCLVEQGQDARDSEQVTLQRGALQLIPALVYGHTLDQIAQRRGLAKTLRELAMLRDGGLVRLETASTASQAASTRASAEAADKTVRPLRPVPPPQITRQRLVRSVEEPRAEATRRSLQTRAVLSELPPPGRSWRSTLRGLFLDEADEPS